MDNRHKDALHQVNEDLRTKTLTAEVGEQVGNRIIAEWRAELLSQMDALSAQFQEISSALSPAQVEEFHKEMREMRNHIRPEQ
jgi:hypothetical protein